MNPEDKKYIWWGLLGIGVAALFYFLSAKNSKTSTNTVNVPYLVPQYSTGASPIADQSLSNQPNIIGSSSNSTVPNFSNPYSANVNPFEAPNTWGWMPNLTTSFPTGPKNNVQAGSWINNQNMQLENGVSGVWSPNHINWGYGPNPGNGQPYIPA